MSKRKNVWVAIESLGIGGAERALFDLICATHDLIDWTVWTRSGRGCHADELPAGVRVFDKSTEWMMRTIQQERPDVFINDIVHELIARSRDIKRAVGKYYLIMHSPHPWSLQFIDKSARKYYDGLLVVAPYLIEAFAKNGFPKDKIHVVPNFIDTQVFKPMDKAWARRQLGLPSEKFLFGYFGRADGDKRVHIMPRILTIVRAMGVDAGLVYVGLSEQGQGDRTVFWDRVRSMIYEAIEKDGIGDHVYEFPPVHNPAMYYNALDATILPSVHEGSPVFPIESLACGVPCVATDVGDLNRCLLDITGSIIIHRQSDIEVLFSDALFRLAKRDKITVAHEQGMAVKMIDQLRSKRAWMSNRNRILGGILT